MTRSACLKSSAIESLNRNTSRLMCGQLPEAGTYDPLPTWRTKRSYPRVLKVWGPRKSTWVSETPASFILFIPQCRLNENYNGKCFDVSMSHDTSFQRVRYEEYKEYAVKKNNNSSPERYLTTWCSQWAHRSWWCPQLQTQSSWLTATRVRNHVFEKTSIAFFQTHLKGHRFSLFIFLWPPRFNAIPTYFLVTSFPPLYVRSLTLNAMIYV